MSLQQVVFRGFANPVDPTPAELRAWAYHPNLVKMQNMPPEWDLLVAGDRLVGTLLSLAMDVNCPARRFALHCLYIYAADAIRTKFRAHPKRRLRKLVEQAEAQGDDQLRMWAHNTRLLLAIPDMFDYHDWCEGGLVREPRRLKAPVAPPGPAQLPSATLPSAGMPSGAMPSGTLAPGVLPPGALPSPRLDRDQLRPFG